MFKQPDFLNQLILKPLNEMSFVYTPLAHLPYLPPKILHNLFFVISPGYYTIPTEIENNAYANKLPMGDVQMAYIVQLFNGKRR